MWNHRSPESLMNEISSLSRSGKLSPSDSTWLGEKAANLLWRLKRRAAEESLVEFIKQSWHIVEPGAEYFHNWHVDMICEHLEAITDGVELDDGSRYNRLLINVPPGMMKSLIMVFYAYWEWTRQPHMRYLFVSHSIDLSIRNTTKARRLIESDWYREIGRAHV